MPQCYYTFPGIAAPKSAIVPRTLGIVPNTIVLEAALQPINLPTIGVLTVGHGIESVTLPDVKVDSATVRLSTNGHVLVVKLLDRRWRWPFLHISGRYNVRLPDGTIDPSTLRTPQELAMLLFTAMGETLFNVSQLPNAWYPEVNWDYRVAAEALHELCEMSGCEVSLNLDNSTSIVRLGVGSALPIDPDLMTPALTVDPPEGPDVVTVLCGETLFESRLKLVPIALDKDGEFKRIDDLSYNAGITNTADITDFKDINKTTVPALSDDEVELCRQLAKKTLYKYYLAVSQAYGGMEVPGYGAVSDMSQLLPLNTILLSSQTAPSGSTKVPVAARIIGTYAKPSGTEDYENTSSELTQAENRFTVDRHSGVVKFTEPVVKVGDNKTGFSAAEIYLQTSYGVRENGTYKSVRYEASRNISGASSGVLLQDVSRQESFSATYIAEYAGNDITTVTNVTDNLSSLDTEVQSVLDTMQSRWTTGIYGFGMYRSIKTFNTDGSIRQVVWYVDDRNGTKTSVSLNSECAAGPIRHLERRRRRMLQHYNAHSPADRRRFDVAALHGAFRRKGF